MQARGCRFDPGPLHSRITAHRLARERVTPPPGGVRRSRGERPAPPRPPAARGAGSCRGCWSRGRQRRPICPCQTQHICSYQETEHDVSVAGGGPRADRAARSPDMRPRRAVALARARRSRTGGSAEPVRRLRRGRPASSKAAPTGHSSRPSLAGSGTRQGRVHAKWCNSLPTPQAVTPPFLVLESVFWCSASFLSCCILQRVIFSGLRARPGGPMPLAIPRARSREGTHTRT